MHTLRRAIYGKECNVTGRTYPLNNPSWPCVVAGGTDRAEGIHHLCVQLVRYSTVRVIRD
jgi:hypothetical protein